MSQLNWEEINIRQLNRRSGGKYVSVNEGRIALSPDACDSIPGVYSYPHVSIKVARNERGDVEKAAIKFTKIKNENTIEVVRRKYKGELIDGININSKQLVSLLFNNKKDKRTTRYSVEQGGDLTLIIDVSKEME